MEFPLAPTIAHAQTPRASFFRRIFSGRLHSLMIAGVAALMLSGCAAGGSGGMGTGYGMGNIFGGDSNAVVTQDPQTLPDVGWQTTKQRNDQRPGLQTLPGAAPMRNVSVAILLPLSGKNADLGQSMLKAAQMAMFDVGSTGYSLVPQDTQGTPAGAAAAAKTAVADGADMILGPIFADDVRAVKSAIGSTGVPVVAFTNDWSQAGSDTYIMGFLPFAQVARVSRYAASKGVQHVGVFAPQTAYADNVIDTLYKTGLRVGEIGRYAPTQTDLSSTVAEFVARSRAAGGTSPLSYQALMLPVGGESLNAVVSVFSQKGLTNKDARFIGTGLWDDESLTRNPALYGSWFAAPDPALRRDFEKRYQENYGSVAPRLASLAYDATAMSAVLARSGGDKPYTRSAMTHPRGFAGIDGVFRFRADGLSERGLAILEIQSGRLRVIDPAPTAFIAQGM